MGKVFEQIFHQRIYRDDKYTNEKYSVISNHITNWKCKLKPQWNTTTHPLEWLMKKLK